MPGAAPPTNSLPAEHHVLAGGSIGHILRNRSINVAGIVPTATDRWFHYDQVGSVMATTNASGALSELRHPDAFGNRMATWQTGLWTNTYAERKGWGHNSKEFDADIGLVYMYQRWYNPELGLFGSKAPYDPMWEHPYTFAIQRPVDLVDPYGAHPLVVIIKTIGIGGAIGTGGPAGIDAVTAYHACESAEENLDKWLHDPKLQTHPRWAELVQKAREERDKDCYGKEGAACKLGEFGQAINESVDMSPAPSPNLKPKPIIHPPHRPPHGKPYDPIDREYALP